MQTLLCRTALFLYALVLVLSGSAWQYGFSQGPGGRGRIEVSIPDKAGLKGIKKILVENGIVRDDLRFEALAVMMQLAHRLKAGEYDLPGDGLPYFILKELEKGSTRFRAIVVPEGSTALQIAGIVEEAGVAGSMELLTLLSDQTLIRSLGLDVDNLEGYLFPDTYRFAKGTAPSLVIRRMVERFFNIYDGLAKAPQPENALSRHQVMTLASIIEKESAHEPERPFIARVFLNRLDQGMPLQADPTVIYGITNFDGNLRKENLRTFSPYNTYMIGGLPPGPIGNPGKTAIDAVLHPAEGKYLYFVSKNDGTHHFSETLKEHNSAVKTYQKAMDIPAR